MRRVSRRWQRSPRSTERDRIHAPKLTGLRLACCKKMNRLSTDLNHIQWIEVARLSTFTFAEAAGKALGALLPVQTLVHVHNDIEIKRSQTKLQYMKSIGIS